MKGVHGRSGPAPDPNALKRERDGATWTTLPADGRPGPPPAWPMPDPTDRELELWARLWALPQAIMWESQRQELDVAQYVRRLAEAEQPGSPVAAGTLVRQLGEGLGVSLPGMLRLRWRIADAAAPAEQPSTRPSSRERFRVVDSA